MVRGSDGELYIPGDYIEMERDIVHHMGIINRGISIGDYQHRDCGKGE